MVSVTVPELRGRSAHVAIDDTERTGSGYVPTQELGGEPDMAQELVCGPPV